MLLSNVMPRFAALVLGLALSLPVAAEPRQAPGSKLALDLPSSFLPSRNFTGFIDEAVGTSIVVLEMPAVAYEQLAGGLTPEALAARGIHNAKPRKLERADTHLYVTAEQDNAQGSFAKFMMAIRDASTTAFVTVNVPKAAMDGGRAKLVDIERILAGAELKTAAAPSKDPFTLSHLGPFKPAGSVLGTTRAFTLDGRFEPPAPGEERAILIVAPSLDRRTVTDPDPFAERLLAGLSGISDLAVTERGRLVIAGIPAIELVGSAKDQASGRPLTLYQALIYPPTGGYFRVVGQMPEAEAGKLLPELRKIARGFQPVE